MRLIIAGTTLRLAWELLIRKIRNFNVEELKLKARE